MKKIQRLTTFAALLLIPSLGASAAEVSEGLSALFPQGLLSPTGDAVSVDVLKDKPVIGVYFSAHWCGPCRAFTPKLVEYHAANKDNFDIVFVSSDKDEAAQKSYMKGSGMTWSTMKYKSEAATALSKKYGVRGIPCLVLLNKDGEIITKDGRSMIGQNIPATKLATAKIVEEEYNCGKCSKVHTRQKVVFPEDEAKKKTAAKEKTEK